MNKDIQGIRELVRDHDPARNLTSNAHKRQAALELIVATPVTASPPGYGQIAKPRLRLVLAVATAAAVVAAGGSALYEAGRSSSRALEPTPVLLSFSKPKVNMSALQVMLNVAARAGSQRDTVGRGRYEYVETRSWYLNSATSGSDTRSAVVPVVTQQWVAANGSGRIRRVPLSGANRTTRAVDKSYGPGGLTLTWRPGSLSSQVAVLRNQLKTGHPAQLGAAEVMTAVADLYAEQPVSPSVRTAILRVVAALPALRYDGTTIDRAGRPGIAVSVDSDMSGLPTRYVMVFSPVTGQLLDAEQILTKTAGRLHVAIPAVIAYTVYLGAERTGSDHGS